MNENELRELDAWIAEKVMGKKVFHAASASGDQWWWSPTEYCVMRSEKEWASTDRRSFSPTEYAADAMEVLKKCQDKMDCEDIAIGRCAGMEWAGGDWYLYSMFRENRSEIGQWRVNGPTLEIAICLFAKKLFTGK